MKEWLEFAPAWLLLKFVGVLPRPVARALAVVTVRILLFLVPKLRRVAMFNLQSAFPDWSEEQRREAIGKMARYLAWQAVEFARFPRYKRETIAEVIEIGRKADIQFSLPSQFRLHCSEVASQGIDCRVYRL